MRRLRVPVPDDLELMAVYRLGDLPEGSKRPPVDWAGHERRLPSQYVFRENLFLTAVAAIVGIPMGDWLLKFVIDNIVLSMIYFEPRHGPYDIPVAVALTFAFAFLVNLAMQKRLRDVSMTESLKSVE